MNKIFNIKNLLPSVNIIAIIILVIFMFFKKGDLSLINNQLSFISDKIISLEQMQLEMQQKDSLISVIKSENEQIKTYILREFSIQTIQRNKDFKDFQQLSENLKKIGIDVNSLNSNILISYEKKDSSKTNLVGKGDSVFTPTLSIYEFRDSSKHLRLDGEIKILDKSISYKYTYSAKYELLTYYKKNGAFNKQLYGSIICDDPNAKIDLSSIVIKQRVPTFNIGLGVGVGAYYGQNKLKFAPVINVSLYKPIIPIYL